MNYVLDGISNGFRVGFSPSHKLQSAKNNKLSALQHAAVVDEYLAREVSLGRVAGPFTPPPLPNLQVSSLNVPNVHTETSVKTIVYLIISQALFKQTKDIRGFQFTRKNNKRPTQD